MEYKYLSEEEYVELDEKLEDEVLYYHLLKSISKDTLLCYNSDLSESDITLSDIFQKISDIVENKAAVIGFNTLDEMEECWSKYKDELQEWADYRTSEMGLEGGALAFLGRELEFDLEDVFNERNRMNVMDRFIKNFIINTAWDVHVFLKKMTESETISMS